MIHKALRSSDLNQMICYMRSSDLNKMIHESAPKFPIWIKWFAIRKVWSKSNDSRTHSKVPIWIKWFTNPLQSPIWINIRDTKVWSNQMIHDPLKVLIWIKWFAIRDPIGALPNSESFCATMVQLIRSVKNLCFTNHYCFIKSLQAMSKLENDGSLDLVLDSESFELNNRSHECDFTCWFMTSRRCAFRWVRNHSVAREDGSIKNGQEAL